MKQRVLLLLIPFLIIIAFIPNSFGFINGEDFNEPNIILALAVYPDCADPNLVVLKGSFAIPDSLKMECDQPIDTSHAHGIGPQPSAYKHYPFEYKYVLTGKVVGTEVFSCDSDGCTRLPIFAISTYDLAEYVPWAWYHLEVGLVYAIMVFLYVVAVIATITYRAYRDRKRNKSKKTSS